MAYINAVFYVDFESGSDAARAALAAVAVANNGSGAVRCTKAGHGLVSGAVVDGTVNYIGAWIVAVIDANNFDLVGSTYSTSTAMTVTPRGGSSKADAWATLGLGATSTRIQPGDTVRIKESPPPVSVGQNVTVTNSGTVAQQAVKTIVSSTNATPIAATLNNVTDLAVGDFVDIWLHTTNTNANGRWKLGSIVGNVVTLLNPDGTNSVGNGVGGATGSVRRVTHHVFQLTTAVNKAIACTGNADRKTNWTASANVTCSLDATAGRFKNGVACQSIAIGAAFTTGKAAYWPLPATLDLSTFQQITLWVQILSGTSPTAAQMSIALCSDALGNTPVDTLNLPTGLTGAANFPITISKGSALGAAIQSIALYVNSDLGAQTVLLDNISATKAAGSADCLTLNTPLGLNTGDEAWWAPLAFDGPAIYLDQGPTTSPIGSYALRPAGYSGPTATGPLYSRNPFVIGASRPNSTQAAMPVQCCVPASVAGTAGNLITYSGGWDAATMTAQSGVTYIENTGVNFGVAQAFLGFDKWGVSRGPGVLNVGADTTWGTMWFNNSSNVAVGGIRFTATGKLSSVGCESNAFAFTAGGCYINEITHADSSVNSGVVLQNNAFGNTILKLTAQNNAVGTTAYGLNGSGTGGAFRIGDLTAKNNTTAGFNVPSTHSASIGNLVSSGNNYGFSLAGSNPLVTIGGGSTSGNTTGAINFAATPGLVSLRNFTLNEATKISPAISDYLGQAVRVENDSGVTDAMTQYIGGGLSVTTTSVVDGTAPYSWKLSPTNVVRATAAPIAISLCRLAVKSGVPVTVTARGRRDNTGLTLRVRIAGGQCNGVGTASSDLTYTAVAAANTWEDLPLTFTPTEDGVIEVLGECFGGTTFNGYLSAAITIT